MKVEKLIDLLYRFLKSLTKKEEDCLLYYWYGKSVASEPRLARVIDYLIVEEEIREYAKKRKKVVVSGRKIRLLNELSIAAILTFLTLDEVLYCNVSNCNWSQYNVFAKEILFESNKAALILSDGKKVLADDLNEREIISGKNAVIKKLSFPLTFTGPKWMNICLTASAYFEVAKNSPNLLFVKSNEQFVIVKGTQFVTSCIPP